MLLNCLSTRAGALYQLKPRRAPKAQPNSDEKRKTRFATEAESDSQTRDARIQRTVADLSRSKTGDAGKAACRFYFGVDVSGRSCNRSGAECNRSHDVRFWGNQGFSHELVYDAFSAADNRLVAYDGDDRDRQRRQQS